MTQTIAASNVDAWAIGQGSWDLSSTSATYCGVEVDNDRPGMLIAPDEYALTRGAIAATVRMEHDAAFSQARIVFGHDSETGAYMAAGLGGHNGRFVVETWEPEHHALRRIKVHGHAPATWPASQLLAIQIRGRRLSLMVNGATMLTTLLPRAIRPGQQIGLSAWGTERVAFDSITVQREDPLAFVVMQFKGYERLYQDAIKPLRDSLGIDVQRVDELLGPGRIVADIERGIEEADLVIAEITQNNANVFYEVGFAYALRKPVLLLAKKGRKLPFDLLVERCFFYDDSPQGPRAVASELQKRVAAALTTQS